MSERPFITVPCDAWLRDAALNGCAEDAISLFKVIAENTDRDWRLRVAAGNHAFSVRQCFKDPDRFRRWSEERIDRCLAELRARGCLLLATANDREWLEIADRLCYCKGHVPERALAPPEQLPLRMESEPQLFALPTPRNGLREEKRKRKEDESARKPVATSSPPAPQKLHDSETRAVSAGKTRPGSVEDETLDAVQALHEDHGLREACDFSMNRRLWVTYLNEDPVALREAVGNLRNKIASGLKPKTRLAAWLTDEFQRIRNERKESAA